MAAARSIAAARGKRCCCIFFSLEYSREHRRFGTAAQVVLRGFLL
jgi:hypothetical protein